VGNLSHGKIDAVISSPPYEETLSIHAGGSSKKEIEDMSKIKTEKRICSAYTESNNNIGNLKGETYLSAMHTIYAECYNVLKPNGLMILITKNFIRQKKLVRLDLDTIKLCEYVGFILKDRYYFRLPQQSFWRINYYKKYPNAPRIEF